ncbi:hypothetical protein OEZ86_006392 [Tetradesmus obliquus]|nr:hypothetical protein OEZ86_006392 [Tetradesmus obliquus]
MKLWCFAVLLGCAVCAAGQADKAPPKVLGTGATVTDRLKQNGFSLFLQLLPIAGITRTNPTAAFTIMAPTDEALKTWMGKMNLTMAELKERPGLVAAVVAYHVIPRVKANKGTLTSAKPLPDNANPILGLTADGVYHLRFYLENGQVVIKDVQGNTARVVKPDIDAGYSVIHGIDKVMLSGDVYLTVKDFLTFHPSFDEMRLRLEKSGVIKDMKLADTVATVFAPTDEAFEAAGPALKKLTPQQLQQVLRYHVLLGEYTLPADLKPGQAYATALKGQTIKLTYTPITVNNKAGLDIDVVPAAGILGGTVHTDVAHVALANFFAKKTAIHGIDAVLLPNIGLPAGIASKPAAAAAAAAAAQLNRKGSATNGRRLLQRGFDRMSVGAMTTNSVAMTNTQSAIRAAVNGQISTAGAADEGLMQQQRSSVRCFNCLVNMPGDQSDWVGVGH